MACMLVPAVIGKIDWPPAGPGRIERLLRDAIGSLCKDPTAWSSAGLLIGTTASREVVVGQPLWAGVDAGKSDHYCVVIDADGKRLLSRRGAHHESGRAAVFKAVTARASAG